jgi:aryl-alcohol dehydrogenase-like predicted oxidoreductase
MRLRVDVIDLYQIHWPDPEPEIEAGCTKAKKASSRRKAGLNTASRSVSARRLLMSSGNRTDFTYQQRL